MDGYWGAVTADYDWCEQNYVVTSYIAEFWNCVSSIAIFSCGLYYLRQSLRFNYGLRFTLASCIVAVIGLGSIAFHGTLTKYGQWLDEIPMLFGSLIFFYITCCNSMTKTNEKKYSTTLGVILLSIGVATTYIYFTIGFFFFLVMYIAVVASVFGITLYQLRPKSPARKYALYSIGMYIFGFAAFWIPEQIVCGNRNIDRHDSGLLALPVPLHAFFHLTSAVGPVYMLVYLSFEYLERRKRKPTLVYEKYHALLFFMSVDVVHCSEAIEV